MTKTEFIEKFKVKQEKTVNKWLNNGYLPGSKKNEDTGMWEIPADARPPYTEKRVHENGGSALYTSIVRACNKGKNVFPSLYNMTDDRFQQYIQVLIEADFITEYKADGITYYEPTLKSLQFASYNKSMLEKFVQESLASISKGLATAVMECAGKAG